MPPDPPRRKEGLLARSPLRPPPLPREHGAWVIFALPLVLGIGLAGPRSAAAWLVACAALLAFLSHHALVPPLQRRLGGKPAPPGWARSRAAWGVQAVESLVRQTLEFVVAVRGIYAQVIVVYPDPVRILVIGVVDGVDVCPGRFLFRSLINE